MNNIYGHCGSFSCNYAPFTLTHELKGTHHTRAASILQNTTFTELDRFLVRLYPYLGAKIDGKLSA